MTVRAKQVVVLSDHLRPAEPRNLGTVDKLAVWLHSLIKHQLLEAGAEDVALVRSDKDGVDVAGFYRQRGTLANPLADWLTFYSSDEVVPEVVRRYEPFVKGKICIGFELSPYQVKAFEILKVPYIDLWIHPIRFLDDLLLAGYSSNAEVNEILGSYSIRESRVKQTAGLRQATISIMQPLPIPEETLLVLGQCRIDRSQIHEGKLIDIQEHATEIKKAVARYPNVLIKPHPYEPNHPLLDLVRQLAPHAQNTQHNSYRLMALPQVKGVLGINSSTLLEGRYFGKEVHQLIPLPLDVSYRGGLRNKHEFASLDSDFLNADFWRDVLRPLIPTTPKDEERFPVQANRMRISLQSFWGFNQIDTDFMVNVARKPLNVNLPEQPGTTGDLTELLRHEGDLSYRYEGNLVFLVGATGAIHGPDKIIHPGHYQLRFQVRYRDWKGGPLLQYQLPISYGKPAELNGSLTPEAGSAPEGVLDVTIPFQTTLYHNPINLNATITGLASLEVQISLQMVAEGKVRVPMKHLAQKYLNRFKRLG
jgi:hypothetical protein